MGKGQSKGELESPFSLLEEEDLKSSFSNKTLIIHPKLSNVVNLFLQKTNSPPQINFNKLAFTLTKGAITNRNHFCSLFSSNFNDIEDVISSLAISYKNILQIKEKRDLPKDISPRFIRFILESCIPPPSKPLFNDDEEVKHTQIPMLPNFIEYLEYSIPLQTLWDQVWSHYFFPLTTKTTFQPQLSSRSDLLTWEDLFILNLHIPQSSPKPKLKNLFTTAKHGHSWTLFQSKIEDVGTTLIIVRSKKGFIFGAFASECWIPKPNFYGNADSFVFSLSPELKLYHSTGINSNFQYFNYSTTSLPNGLGFGGQMEYFGLWIDAKFEKGYCRCSTLSSTFGNPRLSGDEEFEIDFVEAWLVSEKEVDDRYIEEPKASILSDAANMEFLEMAGRKLYSNDLNQADDIDNSEYI